MVAPNTPPIRKRKTLHHKGNRNGRGLLPRDDRMLKEYLEMCSRR